MPVFSVAFIVLEHNHVALFVSVKVAEYIVLIEQAEISIWRDLDRFVVLAEVLQKIVGSLNDRVGTFLLFTVRLFTFVNFVHLRGGRTFFIYTT